MHRSPHAMSPKNGSPTFISPFRLNMLAFWSNDGKFEVLKEIDESMVEGGEEDEGSDDGEGSS
jgi:hypothetical protein